MSFCVSEEALARATKCNRGKICRLAGWTPCGVVSTRLDDTLLVRGIVEARSPVCAYHVLFGDDHCCTCPVRVEIYKKNGI